MSAETPKRLGRPREYGDRVQTAVRMPLDLHRRLSDAAEARDTSVNRLICKAAAYYLDRLPPLGIDEGSRTDG